MNFTASATAMAITETVSMATPTVIVTSSSGAMNPTSAFGQSVTFTATVAGVMGGAAPGGTVTFTYTPMGGMPTQSADARQRRQREHEHRDDHHDDAAARGADDHGDLQRGCELHGGEWHVTQTVTQATPTVSVRSSSAMNRSVFGTSVTFTATVTGIGGVTPTGTVAFTSGGQMLGSGMLTPVMGMAGVASVSVTTSALPVGMDTVTASYNSDMNYATASGMVTQTVTQATPTVTVTSSSGAMNPTSVFGQSVTFTVTVTGVGGVSPTGTVAFTSGGTSLGAAVMLTPGTGMNAGTSTASLTTRTLPAGMDTITASYNGDTTYGTASGMVTQTVTKAGTMTGLTAMPNPAIAGTNVTLTATVTSGVMGATPTGSVTFQDVTTMGMPVTLGTGAVTVDMSGRATLVVTSLPVGVRQLVAVYSGDANFAGGSAAAVSETVIAVQVQSLSVTAPVGGTSGNSGSATQPVIKPGGTLQLTVVSTLNNGMMGGVAGLMYGSSNGAVVSVDANGMLTANAAGMATITISASNGVQTTISVTVTMAAGVAWYRTRNRCCTRRCPRRRKRRCRNRRVHPMAARAPRGRRWPGACRRRPPPQPRPPPRARAPLTRVAVTNDAGTACCAFTPNYAQEQHASSHLIAGYYGTVA